MHLGYFPRIQLTFYNILEKLIFFLKLKYDEISFKKSLENLHPISWRTLVPY